MDTYKSPLDLVRAAPPENPVACVRPGRVALAVGWFQDKFPGEVLYAVKANPSPWVLDALYGAGLRTFDVASEAEIELICGRYADARLAFMHPVKSRRAIRRAYHDFGVRTFVLDSADELDKILAETGNARDLTLVVRLTVSNDGASLPLSGKFGIGGQEAQDLLFRTRRVAAELGVSFHVGSQCMRPVAYRAAMMEASRLIKRAGVTVDIVDVGGGFPSIYPGMNPPPMQAYVDEILASFDAMGVINNADLWCEPGRALVAESCSIVVRVDARKGDALYLNDGSYGNLFDATHAKWPFPVKLLREPRKMARRQAAFKFYGPTCDSIDAAQGPFELPEDVREGDYLEIGMLGAYGVAMQTRFNGFGATDEAIVTDAPWASMYAATPLSQPQETGAVVSFPARKRKRRR